MNPKRRDDLDRLIALFFMAWRGFAAEPDLLLGRHGLGRVHHRLLFTVVRLPGVRVGDLAATLGITRQALHRPLAELSRRRLVEVKVAKESRRERALFATERGRDLEERASGAQRAELARAFASTGARSGEGWTLVMQALAAPIVSRAPGFAAALVDPSLREAASGA